MKARPGRGSCLSRESRDRFPERKENWVQLSTHSVVHWLGVTALALVHGIMVNLYQSSYGVQRSVFQLLSIRLLVTDSGSLRFRRLSSSFPNRAVHCALDSIVTTGEAAAQ